VLNPNIWRGQQREFEWQGHHIRYQDQGHGPALVLLHGLPGSSWDWHLLWPMLCGQFRLIAPDFLGCGDSDKPLHHDYRLSDQAAIIGALLHHLSITDYQIVAHDYGAAVAWQLTQPIAKEQANEKEQEQEEQLPSPSLLQTMTWLAPRIAGDRDFFLWRERWLSGPSGQILSRLVTEGLFGRYLEKLTGPYTPLSQQRLQDSWQLLCAHQGLQVLPHLLNYRYELPLAREWQSESSPVPLQIICGSHDPLSHKLPGIPGSEQRPLSCGHYPQLESSELLAPLLLSFHCSNGAHSNGIFTNLKSLDTSE